MLIYSIAPAELLMEWGSLPEMQCRQTDFGYISGHDTPEGFRISRLHSTDPSVYLRSETAPGMIWSAPERGASNTK